MASTAGFLLCFCIAKRERTGGKFEKGNHRQTESDRTSKCGTEKGFDSSIKHKPTDAWTARKGCLMAFLIDNRTKVELMIQVHIGLLDMFQGFVKRFQTKKPMCHLLQSELFQVVKRLQLFPPAPTHP